MELRQILIFLHIFLQLTCIATTNITDDLICNILQAWHGLGWKVGTIVYHNDLQHTYRFRQRLAKLASMTQIGVSFIQAEEVRSNYFTSVSMATVFDWETLKRLIQLDGGRNDKVLLVHDKHTPLEEYMTWNYSASFYTLEHRDDNSIFSRIQTRPDNSKPIRNVWERNTDTGFFHEVFDMQGSVIKMVTLDWQPWFVLGPCKIDGYRDCISSGYVHELFSALGRIFNFTWRVDAVPSQEWGVVPANSDSWMEQNLTFQGVTSELIYDNYDLSPSGWFASPGRDLYMDFTFSYETDVMLAFFNKRKPSIDTGLFLRAFNSQVWTVLCITVISWFLLQFLCSEIFGKFQMLKEWTIFNMSITFLLVHAFYGGAMTTFFSSGVRPPFETLQQGLSMYPSWKMASTRREINFTNDQLNNCDFLFYVIEELAIVTSLAHGEINGKGPFSKFLREQNLFLPSYKDLLELVSTPGYFGWLVPAQIEGTLSKNPHIELNSEVLPKSGTRHGYNAHLPLLTTVHLRK